jgi:anti-anti-sigma factor
MDIQRIQEGDVLVLVPVGRLDTTTSTDFESHVLGELGGGANRFVVDCSRLDYVSSAGLRVLLMLAKRLSGGKGSLVLSSMSPQVHEVFEIAGFSRIFSIASDRRGALDLVSQGTKDAGSARRAPRAPAAPPPGPPHDEPAPDSERTVAMSYKELLAREARARGEDSSKD